MKTTNPFRILISIVLTCIVVVLFIPFYLANELYHFCLYKKNKKCIQVISYLAKFGWVKCD